MYGGFVHGKITQLLLCNPETQFWEGTRDFESFIFTFKDNKPLKFDMKEEKKKENKNKTNIFIGQSWSRELFNMGFISECEMTIAKKGHGAWCHQSVDSYYDFGGNQCALTYKMGYGDENKNDIKRVVVIQFK